MIAERVQAGADWLDEVRPGWENRVDLAHLVMSDPKYCILGQVFSDRAMGLDTGYTYTMAILDSTDDDWNPMVSHGFSIDESSDAENDEDDTWANLDHAWRRLITERRGA